MATTMIAALLWLFGVAAILYGTTLRSWAWTSPDDAQAARLHIIAGLAACGMAAFIA